MESISNPFDGWADPDDNCIVGADDDSAMHWVVRPIHSGDDNDDDTYEGISTK